MSIGRASTSGLQVAPVQSTKLNDLHRVFARRIRELNSAMTGIPSRAPTQGLMVHSVPNDSDSIRRLKTANTGRWLRVGTRRGPVKHAGGYRSDGDIELQCSATRFRLFGVTSHWWDSTSCLAIFAGCVPTVSHTELRDHIDHVNVCARAETSLTVRRSATPMTRILPREQRRMAGCFSYPPAGRHGALTRRCRRVDERAVRPVRAHRQASSIGVEV